MIKFTLKTIALASSLLATTLCPLAASPAVETAIHHKVITYSLGAGASTEAYKIPASTPVSVTGCQLALGFRGVGSVTLLRIKDSFLEWVGLESAGSGATTEGFGSASGTHILWIDFDQSVDIEVNDANSFIIHNASGSTANGKVTLTY